MWLIFKTDLKIKYMIEVFETETLQGCAQKIHKLHPFPRTDIQFVYTLGGTPLEQNLPISEIGLKDNDTLWIDFLNDKQKTPRRTISANAPITRNLIISRTKSEGC